MFWCLQIFNWKPAPYDDAELRDNKEIPASVKENYGKRTGGDQLVYITCEGEVS